MSTGSYSQKNLIIYIIYIFHNILLQLPISHYKILTAVTSSSDQYGIENGVVSWEPAKAFSNIPIDCISGYQYTINGTIIGTVSNPSFTLDCIFTDIHLCSANTLIIRSIVMVGNSVLNNVAVTGHTCNRGNYKLTLAVTYVMHVLFISNILLEASMLR